MAAVIGKERLSTVLRVAFAVAAALILPISSAFLFSADPARTWVHRAPALVGFALGVGLAFLAISGRRSPFFETLAEAAYQALCWFTP